MPNRLSLLGSVLCVLTNVLAQAPRALAQANWPHNSAMFERQLSNETIEQRRATLSKLDELPKSAARHWVERFIGDDDSEVREAVGEVAIRLRFNDMGAVGEAWVQSSSTSERRMAIQFLLLSSSVDAVRGIGPLVTDYDKAVRLAATLALGRLPASQHKLASEFLFTALGDREPEVRAQAAQSLGLIGLPLTAGPLSGYLQDTDDTVRFQVARALGVIGDQAAVPGLLLALGDLDDRVVAAAAWALEMCADNQTVLALLSVLTAPRFGAAQTAAFLAISHLEPAALTAELARIAELADARDAISELARSNQIAHDLDLQQCLMTAVLSPLEFCAQLHLLQGGTFELLLTAVEQRRMSWSKLFELASASPPSVGASSAMNQIVIRALEFISLPEYAGADFEQSRAQALNFLSTLTQLSNSAARPLADALHLHAGAAATVVRLLAVLSRTALVFPTGQVTHYVEATEPLVRQEAARVLVAAASDEKTLRALLFFSESDVAHSAAVRLGQSMSPAQSKALLNIAGNGPLAHNSELKKAFYGVTAPLSARGVMQLTQLWDHSWAADRSWLVPAVTVAVPLAALAPLVESSTTQEQQIFAQLLAFRPGAAKILRKLASSSSDRVVAVAIESLAYFSQFENRSNLLDLARGRALFVRAAAVRGIRLQWSHQKNIELSSDIFSKENCDSKNSGLAAATWGLAAEAQMSCGGVEPSLALLIHDDPRIRLEIARGMALSSVGTASKSQALLACFAYDKNAEVSQLCKAAYSKKRSTNVAEPLTDMSRLLRNKISVPWADRLSSYLPHLVLFDGRPRLLVSDGFGEIYLPPGPIETLDAELVY